jgi:hypothetical protein
MKKNLLMTVFKNGPTRRNLHPLTLVQMQALCEVQGIPKSGRKDQIRDRILATWQLRQLLHKYENDPAALTSDFKAEELKGFCRIARCYSGGNKYGRAAALLGWRNECRRKGQKVIDDAREALRQIREQRETKVLDAVNIAEENHDRTRENFKSRVPYLSA